MKTFGVSSMLAIAMLALFSAGGLALFSSVPRIKTVRAVEVPPVAGGITLGWQDLGQRYDESRSADLDHLRVRKGDSGWEIANVSLHRKVDAGTDRFNTLFLKRWEVRAGDTLTVDGKSLRVDRVEPGVLVFRDLDTSISCTWDGEALRFPEPVFVYDDTPFSRKLRRKIGRWAQAVLPRYREREIRCFSVGGRVHTPDRFSLPGVPPGTVIVYRRGDRFFFGPGRGDVPVEMTGADGEPVRFSQLFLPLDGEYGKVRRLVLGRTHYRVDAGPDRFRLTPSANQDVWPLEADLPEPRSSVITLRVDDTPRRLGETDAGIHELIFRRPRESFLLFLFLTVLCLAGVKALLARPPRGRSRKPFVAGAWDESAARWVASAAVPCTLFLWRARSDVDLSTLLLLALAAWGWATFHLIRKNRLEGKTGNLWAAALFLAGAGTLTLTQLALGADNTRWIDFARRHVLLLSLFGWIVPLLNRPSGKAVREAWTTFVIDDAPVWKWLRRGAAVLGGAVLVLQLFFGNEQGLWNIQPAEIGKFLLVFVAAFVGMDLRELRNLDARPFQDDPVPWIWRVLRVLFFFSLLVMTVLLGVRDRSPVFILTIFLIAWLWAVAPHPWEKNRSGLLFRGVLFLMLLVLAGTLRWAYENPETIPEWIPQRDRFLVWAQPELHAYSGEQALKAVTLAGAAGWTGGTEPSFGFNGRIMDLPMVHNDFIGSFVIFKFGGFTALLFLLVQMIYLQTLFDIGREVREKGENAGHRHRKSGYVLYLVLFGLAWVHGAQWLIAWGNVLGLLPVMGQPMTWISLAISHMAFFGLPTLALAMLAGRMIGADDE